jgi:hypothetical protein
LVKEKKEEKQWKEERNRKEGKKKMNLLNLKISAHGRGFNIPCL